MTFKRLLAKLALLTLCVLFTQIAFSQTKLITGKISDEKGNPIQGATVTAKGSKSGTSTDAAGAFSLNVPAATRTLVISSVGFGQQEVSITDKTSVSVSLTSSSQSLNDVVVIGYGTARKRDLTGSVASVQAKDFNKGVVTNPDQLLQGKVAGLQIINSSGQPGAATITKIRGNNSIRTGNTPLYVIDGIPLDGRSPRPGLLNTAGIGTLPDANPLLFLNPADIASIDVLKDASASAIYGSRGANGVILITTKKGQSGITKLDVGASVGFGEAMRKIKTLSASGYRAALKTYNAPSSDSGASVDPFKAILQTPVSQNYSFALSGGTETGKYRASFLYSDQPGLIRKSGLKKYVGNFNGQYKFLDKKLSMDFNVTAAHVGEQVAPISQDAGSGGNLISLALIWNPTLALQRSNGIYNQTNPSGQLNPLAYSSAYNDYIDITTLLASFSAGYKITPDLEYKLLYGINYGTGARKGELQGWISGADAGVARKAGLANIGNTQLLSQTITHTLNYNKQLSQNLSINAVAGFEYFTTTWQGNQQAVYGFDLNLAQDSIVPGYHYYDNIQDGKQGNLQTTSFKDPSVELQSYFARVALNYHDKYLLTGTFRADGSSKFGANNKYAYFPSLAAAWNVTNEGFMKDNKVFNNLKVRLGWGRTGNQEFNPVDAAIQVGTYTSNNSFSTSHFANPDLKWETVQSTDAGIDFTILNNRVFGFVDYFDKKTINPILDFAISEPTAGSGTVYKNMDGVQAQKAWITNKGIEISLGAAIIEKKDLTWTVSVNGTFVKNKFISPQLANVPYVKNTGSLHGQGSSGAYSEVIANGQPIDVFYLPEFQGYSSGGIGKYSSTPTFSGDPNPSLFLGISSDLTYKKLSLVLNFHGSYGNKIFNNTAMSVLNLSNIIGGRNIAANLLGNGENVANAITPSTRFLESGNYMKLGNATISYRIGNIGNSIKGMNVYVSGSNLFVITKYHGFDPEANTSASLNGVPSLGVDYIGYPSVRSINVGLSFSL